ncbi:hypothetical protein [Sinorhizobium saheli]|uniref:hypothetical protein n=1 Tax=Sinorhizobium saheli TaxID=36856 RepID=UPI001295DDF7|nr:hypothetical protein [Sinorhizobium saheli]MQW85982.1 hypothetical protein [Sinorhizobium saheli]
MRVARNIYAVAGLSFSQAISATNSWADGTNGLFGRISGAVAGASEGKPVAGKVAGIAKNAISAGTGFAGLAQFQEKAKIGVSDDEMRATADRAFAGIKGFGGVVGALIIKPFQTVGVNNAVINKNETSLADAYLSGDAARIQAAAEQLERSRAYVRTQPKLGDPSWDIISAGTAGKVRAAATAVQVYQDYSPAETKPREHPASIQAPYPAAHETSKPSETAHNPLPACSTAEAHGQVGGNDCALEEETQPTVTGKWSFIFESGTDSMESRTCSVDVDEAHWQQSLQTDMEEGSYEDKECQQPQVMHSTDKEFLSRQTCTLYGYDGSVRMLAANMVNGLYLKKESDELVRGILKMDVTSQRSYTNTWQFRYEKCQ